MPLNNFDIYREVGYRTALVKDYAVTVSDGVLSLKFNPTIDRLALAGVEIFQAKTKATVASSVSSLVELAPRQEESAARLQLYPNPVKAGEQVQVVVSGFQAEEVVTLRLQDVMGRLVQQRQVLTDGQGQARAALPVAGGGQSGVYILQAQGRSQQVQGKLVLE